MTLKTIHVSHFLNFRMYFFNKTWSFCIILFLIKQTCIFCDGLRQIFLNERQGPSFLIYELLLNRFPNLYICCKIDSYFHYELFLHVELAGSWLKFGSYILDRIYLWFYRELISCGLLRFVFGERGSYISIHVSHFLNFRMYFFNKTWSFCIILFL